MVCTWRHRHFHDHGSYWGWHHHTRACAPQRVTCAAAAAADVESPSSPSLTLFRPPYAHFPLQKSLAMPPTRYPQVLLDLITLDMPIRRWLLAPRAVTQMKMDRLYVREADIYLAFRTQLSCKFVVICCMFGTAMPILYACAALFFGVGSLIDRYNLLRGMAPPPQTTARLVQTAHEVVFPLAIVSHAISALFFFFQLEVEQATFVNLFNSPPPAPPTAPAPLTPPRFLPDNAPCPRDMLGITRFCDTGRLVAVNLACLSLIGVLITILVAKLRSPLMQQVRLRRFVLHMRLVEQMVRGRRYDDVFASVISVQPRQCITDYVPPDTIYRAFVPPTENEDSMRHSSAPRRSGARAQTSYWSEYVGDDNFSLLERGCSSQAHTAAGDGVGGHAVENGTKMQTNQAESAAIGIAQSARV